MRNKSRLTARLTHTKAASEALRLNPEYESLLNLSHIQLPASARAATSAIQISELIDVSAHPLNPRHPILVGKRGSVNYCLVPD
jgi:hypothetical protein